MMTKKKLLHSLKTPVLYRHPKDEQAILIFIKNGSKDCVLCRSVRENNIENAIREASKYIPDKEFVIQDHWISKKRENCKFKPPTLVFCQNHRERGKIKTSSEVLITKCLLHLFSEAEESQCDPSLPKDPFLPQSGIREMKESTVEYVKGTLEEENITSTV